MSHLITIRWLFKYKKLNGGFQMEEHFNKVDRIIEDIQQTTNKVKELLAKAEEINKKL